jgi:alanyl-tRNA synthetase
VNIFKHRFDMEYIAFAQTMALRGVARSSWAGAALPTSRRSAAPVARRLRLSQWRRVSFIQAAAAAQSRVPSDTQTVSIPVGKRMGSSEIRNSFLAFYAERGHARKRSASLIPDDPSILLTIAGMVPFKPIFVGSEAVPDPPRATSSQKCIRTNDIENVGVTKRHHTFFEMLGNFSFGDYFKREAIVWAWELLTRVYEIPPERLAVSVYEDDDEAFQIWRDVVGIRENRIQRMGAEDNFWASGPTGPCGPCSEIYFDFDPSSAVKIDLNDDERFIELYNLVFMQYARGSDGDLTPLETQNIDTGMGLERMAQVLQQVENNYETDLIRPIMDAVAELAGMTYDAASPKETVSLKVAGDHIRAVAHLMADGVRASNIGRGYIVRRLVRRVVRHGRLLGINGPFISRVLPVVATLATEAGLVDVASKLEDIQQEVVREELRFLDTLERGEALLNDVVAKALSSAGEMVSGADAFELYDTYGFPFELTEEVAGENGLLVDREAFEQCMNKQRVRARAARAAGEPDLDLQCLLQTAAASAGPTAFSGHTRTSISSARITAIVLEERGEVANVAREGQRVRILLDETPFYAEGGGQVGDTGVLELPERAVVRVNDTRKEAGAHVHVGQVENGSIAVGDEVRAEVYAPSRRRIQAHHTATHLLQAALKQVVEDGGISQAGSLVDADKLRFDFNCPRAVTQAELSRVESLINFWIDAAYDTVVESMPINVAKEKGAVAMFGEKYGTEVRVVDVPGVSMELCGGTHVVNTADIGIFKIVSESGPSSGVRRIEAVCGGAVLPYLSVRDDVVKKLCLSLKSRPDQLPDRVSSLQQELRSLTKELELLRTRLMLSQTDSLANSVEHRPVGSFVIAEVDGDVSGDSLKSACESLSQRLGDKAVVLLAGTSDGKVSFACAVGKELHKNTVIHAGNLVAAVAKACGGGGGGRPNIAQAGARDPSKIDDALVSARTIVEKALSNSESG